MILSKRLQAIANQVPSCKTMADIGTDHGILPIYLCLNHRINQAYACDIAPKSLNKAIEKIKKYHLEKQITPLLSDGMKMLPQSVESIVIAGMGGHLMTKILNESPHFHPHLILQANTHMEMVRMWLMENQYVIVDESIVFEKKQYYEIIHAKKTNESIFYDDFALKYGPILMQKKDPIWLQKYHQLLITYTNIDRQLQQSQKKDVKLLQKIEEIKKIVQD